MLIEINYLEEMQHYFQRVNTPAAGFGRQTDRMGSTNRPMASVFPQRTNQHHS